MFVGFMKALKRTVLASRTTRELHQIQVLLLVHHMESQYVQNIVAGEIPVDERALSVKQEAARYYNHHTHTRTHSLVV